VAPATLAQPKRTDVQRGYFLQAGSFTDLGNAHALRNKLRDLGDVSVAAADVNGTHYYRVMVGPWATRAEAENTQGNLGASGMKTIVVARLN
jgi:rare lipoprotein A